MAAALTAALLAAPADGQAAEPTVKLETSMGDIVVQLNSRKAPLNRQFPAVRKVRLL